MSEILYGILFGLVSLICWGTANFLLKSCVDKEGVPRTIFWVEVMGLIMFAPLLYLFWQPVSFSDFPILIAALIFGGIPFFVYLNGFKRGKVSIIAAIGNSAPLYTAIFAYFLLGERLGFKYIGIVIIVSGVILASFQNFKGKGSTEKGILFAIVSAILWGFYIIILDVAIDVAGWVTPLYLAVLGSLLLSILFLLKNKEEFMIKSPKNLRLVLLTGFIDILGFFGTGAGLLLGAVSIYAAVSGGAPAVTAILAFLFYKEKISLHQIVGIIMIILGIILLSFI